MKFALKSLAVIAWLGLSAPMLASVAVAQQDSNYADGISDYQAGRYRQALIRLAKASGAQPQNAMIHYYLANALVKAAEHDSAAEEYRIAYILDPLGSVSGYCLKALRAYKKPIPCPDEIKAFRDTVNGALAIGQTKSLDSQNADPRLAKVLSNIRREVSLEKNNDQSRGDYRAQGELNNGSYQARRVDQWAQDEIAAVHSDPLVRFAARNNASEAEAYIKQREAEIRSAAKAEQDYWRREANARAARYKRVAENRQNVLDEVAENLARQMTETPKPGGVRLVATGTDLYVRRYAPASGSYQSPDAHAAVVRIYNSPPPAAEPAEPTRSVHAKVLN